MEAKTHIVEDTATQKVLIRLTVDGAKVEVTVTGWDNPAQALKALYLVGSYKKIMELADNLEIALSADADEEIHLPGKE